MIRIQQCRKPRLSIAENDPSVYTYRAFVKKVGGNFPPLSEREGGRWETTRPTRLRSRERDQPTKISSHHPSGEAVVDERALPPRHTQLQVRRGLMLSIGPPSAFPRFDVRSDSKATHEKKNRAAPKKQSSLTDLGATKAWAPAAQATAITADFIFEFWWWLKEEKVGCGVAGKVE